MKILLVGELNPYGPDDHYALYPAPRNSAGARLAKILGLSRTQYLRKFPSRFNLCHGQWTDAEARKHAEEIARECAYGAWDRVVLCGKKPQAVCGFDRADPCWFEAPCVGIPHPSGLNRFWNESRAVERVRGVLREAGVL